MQVDTKAFIKAWEESETVDEVARRLGIEKRRAQMYAGWLRQKGIPLKKFRPGPTKDWEGLADYARSLKKRKK